jgi:hypothetical protein
MIQLFIVNIMSPCFVHIILIFLLKDNALNLTRIKLLSYTTKNQ